MIDKTNTAIDLRGALQYCKDIIEKLDNNTVVAVLREQNEYFGKALDTVEKLIPAAENVIYQDADDIGIQAATAFLISLWSKMRDEESVNDLTQDDWKNIICQVYEQAATIDPREYSRLVFNTYRRSIAFAIEPMRINASQEVIGRLDEIVALMDEYSDALDERTIDEAKYIEENMWLSLEAIFLVMTDRLSLRILPEERRELADALGALAFQKIRYSIYDKELSAIDECLAYQAKLDKRLSSQVDAYIDALRDELDEFDRLVDAAFSSDFRTAFAGSASLAESLDAVDILRSTQDIDDFFLL